MVKNTAISIYRKRKRDLFLDFERETNYEEIMVDNINSLIDAKLIAEKINELPDKYKDVLVLKYFNELSNKEIAVILNITELVVRKRIERARKLLGGKK